MRVARSRCTLIDAQSTTSTSTTAPADTTTTLTDEVHQRCIGCDWHDTTRGRNQRRRCAVERAQIRSSSTTAAGVSTLVIAVIAAAMGALLIAVVVVAVLLVARRRRKVRTVPKRMLPSHDVAHRSHVWHQHRSGGRMPETSVSLRQVPTRALT